MLPDPQQKDTWLCPVFFLYKFIYFMILFIVSGCVESSLLHAVFL